MNPLHRMKWRVCLACSFLIGAIYLCMTSTYFGHLTNETSTPVKETKAAMEISNLKSMSDLPNWYRSRDWGLRKNVSYDALKPLNEWWFNDNETIVAWNNFFYGTTRGLILELGAMDGSMGSVSLFFEAQAGWRSILIEGNPEQAAFLPKNRSNAINFNAVICEKPTTVHFLQAGAIGGIVEFMSLGYLKTFHSKLLTNGKLDKEKLTAASNVYKLPCVPLSNILDPLKIHHIDFFVLDVEGSELSVLKAIDFGKIKFDVIVVETQRTADPEQEAKVYVAAVIDFLTSKGYVLWNRKIGRNSWFTHSTFRGFNQNSTTPQ